MQENIKNRTIFCHDNLEVLQGINSNSIDLIYLDPPFNKKKTFTAPIGSSAEGASFKDIFELKDLKDEWLGTIKQDNFALHKLLNGIREMDGAQTDNFCYLAYMAIRLIEMHRILKETGSIYLHCDPKMSHYLKLVLDCIFNEKNFLNEIIWCYKENDTATKYFPKKHDTIFFYSKSINYFYKTLYGDYTEAQLKRYNHIINGKRYANMKGKMRQLKNGAKIRDWWADINIVQANERTGYPTQKPVELVKRIIDASCPQNGTILDPFCGCATACIAAEKMYRQWIGIDISIKAYELVKKRLEKECNQGTIWENKRKTFFYTYPPKRTDTNINFKIKKWVYVISNPSYSGEFKVGVASDWKSRLNSYQTSDPNRAYKIEYKLLTSNYNFIEKEIHRNFPNKHEWVLANLIDIKDKINELDSQQKENQSSLI